MSDEFADRPAQPKRSSDAFADRPGASPAEPAAGDGGLPKLGSLAQAARGKKLNSIRWTLIAIGILTILANAVFLYIAPGNIRQEIQKEVQKHGGPANVDMNQVRKIEEQSIFLTTLVNGLFVAMGVVFVVLGVIVHRFPVPVTVLALVLYIAGGLGTAAVNPQAAASGLIVKIVIAVLLAKGVQTALAYERERSRDAAAGVA
jgi:hypothetical protein